MTIAIIGAGVNGVCSAIALAEKGFDVHVFEQGLPFQETSAKSSKMFHGGIRYIEQGHINLIKEALEDRAEWLRYSPEATKVSRFYIPIYNKSPRSRIILGVGVKIYEILAGINSLGKSAYHNRNHTLTENPELNSEGLLGSVSYLDVQMNDVLISNKLLEHALSLNVKFINNTKAEKISECGELYVESVGTKRYEWIVNCCGPWVENLINRSDLISKFGVNCIRGSHLVLKKKINNPLVYQNCDKRIIFALPYKDQTILGTTEVAHNMLQKAVCTDQERDYLILAANNLFKSRIDVADVAYSYSGVRPIVRKNIQEKMGAASRESMIEQRGHLINVFGGKWTSAMRLGRNVCKKITEGLR